MISVPEEKLDAEDMGETKENQANNERRSTRSRQKSSDKHASNSDDESSDDQVRELCLKRGLFSSFHTSLSLSRSLVVAPSLALTSGR